VGAPPDPYVLLFNQIPKRGFSICHFKRKGDPKGHFWVTVPVGQETILLVCMITKQLNNRIAYYKKLGNDAAMGSLIPILPGTFSFLNEPETVVECNSARSVDIGIFREMVEKATFSVKCRDKDIPDELKRNVIKAIKDSPVVRPVDRNLLA
jgi:hypothetical protein